MTGSSANVAGTHEENSRKRAYPGCHLVGSTMAMRVMLLIGLLSGLLLALPSQAQADELTRFEEARQAYETQAYAKAKQKFETLVQSENRPLAVESRKYLGATALFLGNEKAAHQHFQALLAEEPSYLLDPSAFPEMVLEFFQRVKTKISETERLRRKQTRARAQQRRQENQAKRAQESERRRALLRLAQMETVEQRNSRWIATIPFGVGQFQNGHGTVGLSLAIAQGLLAAASITTFFIHESLRNEDPDDNSVADANRAERAYRIANWATTGSLLGLMAVGIADAHLRFRPFIRTTRKRALPPSLKSTRFNAGNPGAKSAGTSRSRGADSFMTVGLNLELDL